MRADPLLVDLYELTMVDAYRRHGMAERPATFSLFVRGLPSDRRYLVAAGLDDALEWLEDLRFRPDDLSRLARLDVFAAEFLDWLGTVRFTGTVRAVPEGTILFAGEPLLEVDAPIAEAQLAETFLLNQTTLQTMLATKAARCRHAAGGRAVIDFGLRRAHGIDAGMKLARVAGLVGLTGTSNVAGAARYDVRASGTMAHAFIQAYTDERDAFVAFGHALGDETVLLVDTYDSVTGIDHAIEAATALRRDGVEIRGIRLDSGDLAALARLGRHRLDKAGFPEVAVYASGGLDEHEIHRLVNDERAPIDGFGVGSSLAASTDAPSLDTVYKLVVYDGRPVRKTSTGKQTLPGAKQVWRAADWSADTIALDEEPPPSPNHRPLLVEVLDHGRRTDVGRRSLADANAHFEHEWAGMPDRLKALTGSASHPVALSPGLRDLVARLDRDPTATEQT